MGDCRVEDIVDNDGDGDKAFFFNMEQRQRKAVR